MYIKYKIIFLMTETRDSFATQTFSRTRPIVKLGRSRRTLVVVSRKPLSRTFGVSLIDATLLDSFRCGVQIERLRRLNKEQEHWYICI